MLWQWSVPSSNDTAFSTNHVIHELFETVRPIGAPSTLEVDMDGLSTLKSPFVFIYQAPSRMIAANRLQVIPTAVCFGDEDDQNIWNVSYNRF